MGRDEAVPDGRLAYAQPVIVRFGADEGEIALLFEPDEAAPAGVSCRRGTVRLAGLRGDITALFYPDVRRWRDELEQMLRLPEVSGRLRIFAEHGEVLITMRLERGKGSLTARIEPGHAADGFAELQLSTDQTHAGAALEDVDRLLIAYPGLTG